MKEIRIRDGRQRKQRVTGMNLLVIGGSYFYGRVLVMEADLTYTVGLNKEEYGVGFRKGSDLAAALNDFFAASYKDGSMMECAT